MDSIKAAIVTDSVVCLFLDHDHKPCKKTAEHQVTKGTMYQVLHDGQDSPPHGMGHFKGILGHACGRYSIILNIIRKVAARGDAALWHAGITVVTCLNWKRNFASGCVQDLYTYYRAHD